MGHGLRAAPLLLFLLVPPALAGTPRVSLSAGIGFSGWVVPEVWLPVRVEVQAGTQVDGTLDIEVPNGPAAAGATLYRRELHLSAGVRQPFMIPVVLKDPRRELAVTVRDARGDAVLRQRVPIGHDKVVDGMVVALSAEAAGLEFLTDYARRIRGAYVREDALPDHWGAYAGVDLLVLRDIDDRRLSSLQRRALREWVAQGGRVLVTGDALQHRAWLADLLPAVVSSAQVQAAPGTLLTGMPAPLLVSVLRPKSGAAVLPAHGLPMVVSRPYGRGVVTAWAFDAFAPAVRAWPGRLALWDQLLTGRPARPVAGPDLIDVIPTARTLSGAAQAQIVLLAAFYILAVRFALRRSAARSAGALVLAGIIVAFTVLLYAVSATARRSAAATSQLSIVESTGADNLSRVTTYLAVLLPYGGSYRVTTPEGSLLRPLAGVRLISPAVNAAAGVTPPGVITFEAVQMIPFSLRGRARGSAEGLDLDIENGSGLTITAPTVYLNGQTQMLPDIAEHLAMLLPPGEWQPADRNAASGDFAHDARARMIARLDAYSAPAIIGYKTLWLIGALADPRLAAHLEGAREELSLSLLLSPVHIPGRP